MAKHSDPQAALFDLARDLNRAKSDQSAEAPRLAGELKRLAGVLGLLQQVPETFLKGAQQQVALSEEEIEAKIAEVIVPPPLLTADYLHFSAISLSLSVYIYIERERSTSQMLRVTG